MANTAKRSESLRYPGLVLRGPWRCYGGGMAKRIISASIGGTVFPVFDDRVIFGAEGAQTFADVSGEPVPLTPETLRRACRIHAERWLGRDHDRDAVRLMVQRPGVDCPLCGTLVEARCSACGWVFLEGDQAVCAGERGHVCADAKCCRRQE